MKTSKFTFNSLILIVMIFTAIWFFFTVVMVDLASHKVINEFYPIEGTDLAIRYHGSEPDGIYRGTVNDCTLLVKGSFGSDWGSVMSDGVLYVNEYRATSLGLIMSDVVRIDLDTLEKRVIAKDSVLRGLSASGEAVFVKNTFLPALSPEINPLCALYRVSSPGLRGTPSVEYLDVKTGAVLRSVKDENPFAPGFEERYLEGGAQP